MERYWSTQLSLYRGQEYGGVEKENNPVLPGLLTVILIQNNLNLAHNYYHI
jgi:hypothetical protein